MSCHPRLRVGLVLTPRPPTIPRPADYFRQQLAANSRIGFIFQKLTEPRSYDYQVAQNKAYHDRLRMPQFPFDADDREAIITFVLGLVAQPPAEKYVYVPDSSRSAIIDGQNLLDRYKCTSCHVLEPQKWRLEFKPGSFRPPPEKPVFPLVDFRSATTNCSSPSSPMPADYCTPRWSACPRWTTTAGRWCSTTRATNCWRTKSTCRRRWNTRSSSGSRRHWTVAAIKSARTPVNILGEHIAARQRARGGFLAQYLLPHVVKLERAANPNAKGSQAWGWLPPPLLGEGAKVRPEWLHDYLLAPYVIRPASFMRMPKYNLSPAEAGTLVNYFAAQDGVAYPYQAIDRRDRAYLQQAEPAYRAAKSPGCRSRASNADRLTAAMRIVTDKNYCVTCHMVGDYDPKTSDRAKGPNLADVYKRLRPDYVRRWVAEPVSVLPYTGMPIIVPYQPAAPQSGGVDQSLYPGTSVQQLDALVDLLMNFDAYTRQRAPSRRWSKRPRFRQPQGARGQHGCGGRQARGKGLTESLETESLDGAQATANEVNRRYSGCRNANTM